MAANFFIYKSLVTSRLHYSVVGTFDTAVNCSLRQLLFVRDTVVCLSCQRDFAGAQVTLDTD